MINFKIGQQGYLKYRGDRAGIKGKRFLMNPVPLYEFIGTCGEGERLKLMFRSVNGGYVTCVNPVDFETGDVIFSMEGTAPRKQTKAQGWRPGKLNSVALIYEGWTRNRRII